MMHSARVFDLTFKKLLAKKLSTRLSNRRVKLEAIDQSDVDDKFIVSVRIQSLRLGTSVAF